MPKNKESEVTLSEVENSILDKLMKAPRFQLRWTELMNKTGFSSRTLSRRLKNLENKKRVKRLLDTETRKYPPPVYYQLIGEDERRIAEKIEKEWAGIRERTNNLFTITFEKPERFVEELMLFILRDSIFTLHYAANESKVIQSLLLLRWHTEIRDNLMLQALKLFATSEKHREALRKIYEEAREEALKEQKSQASKKEE